MKPRLILFLCALILILSACAPARTVEPAATAFPTTPAPTYTLVPTATLAPTRTPSPIPTRTSIPPTPFPKIGWRQVEKTSAHLQVRDILIEQDGGVWSAGPGGLLHLDPSGTMTAYTLDSTDPEASQVSALAQTPDGALWVGTLGSGLFQLKDGEWQSFTEKDGLPGNVIFSLGVAKDGTLWAGMVKSSKNERKVFYGYWKKDEWVQVLYGDRAYQQIIAAPDGEILTWTSWYGAQMWFTHVIAYNPDSKSMRERFGYSDGISTIAVGPKNDVWVASVRKIWHQEDGKWIWYVPPWSEKRIFATSMAVGKDGALWLSIEDVWIDWVVPCRDRASINDRKEWGVYRFQNNAWKQYTEKDGLADNQVCVVKAAPDGSIWAGTYDQGLSKFDGKTWTTYK